MGRKKKEKIKADSDSSQTKALVPRGVTVPSHRPSAGLPASQDPLSLYLREIRQHKPLSREEEHELAVSYQKENDIEAAYRLVASNLWLVVKIAREYEQAAKNLLDLIQEGNMGLMEAVKNFDPYRNVRFPSYAVWWIKAYIIRYVIANLRLVKIGTTQAQRKLFFNLNKEKEKLEKMGISPKPKLLAEKLNVREKDVIEMEQRLGAPDVSVDAPLLSDGESNLHGILSSEAPNSEDLMLQKQRREFIQSGFEEFATTLNSKERIIFDRRMVNEDKATLQELSDELDISRERVRQIENKLKEKLKTYFIERLEKAGESPEFST